jgi:hypothetical protein
VNGHLEAKWRRMLTYFFTNKKLTSFFSAAYRCDIRNGDHLSALNTTLRPQRDKVASRLRHHPAVHAVVQEAVFPAYLHRLGQKDGTGGFHASPQADLL